MFRFGVRAALLGLLAGSCLRNEPIDAAPDVDPPMAVQAGARVPAGPVIVAPRATVRVDNAPCDATLRAALVRAEIALDRGDYPAVAVALDEARAVDPAYPGIAELAFEAAFQQAERERMLRPRAITVGY